MTDATSVFSDVTLADLAVLVSKAGRGNKTAARRARAEFNRLDRHLSNGGVLPQAWRTATKPAREVVVDKHNDVVDEGKPLQSGRTNHKVFWSIVDAENGLTDYETEEMLGLTHQSASAARNTLMLRGYVVASGEFRATATGSRATVWMVSEWAQARIKAGFEIR